MARVPLLLCLVFSTTVYCRHYAQLTAYEATIAPFDADDNVVSTTVGKVLIFRTVAHLDSGPTHTIFTKSIISELPAPTCTGDAPCGHHVHDGTACDSAETQGSHLLRADGVDPWAGAGLTADANQTQNVWNPAGMAVPSDYPSLEGKPFVVHDASTGNPRRACGILHEVDITTYVAELDAIDTSDGTASGDVEVHTTTFGHFVTGEIQGVPGTVDIPQIGGSYGTHVHSGTACTDTATQGGHYPSNDEAGPLPQTVQVDPWGAHAYVGAGVVGVPNIDLSNGETASFNFPIIVGTNYAGDAINGKAFVVHDSNSDRVLCGVLHDQNHGGSSASASLGGMAVITAVCLLSYFM